MKNTVIPILNSSNNRLKNIAPCRIQIGDIVDVLVFTLLILIKNRRFKMTMKLCGILLLNATYTDISKYATAGHQILKHIHLKDAYTRQTKTITPPKSRGLQRKLDYEDDDDGTTSKWNNNVVKLNRKGPVNTWPIRRSGTVHEDLKRDYKVIAIITNWNNTSTLLQCSHGGQTC